MSRILPECRADVRADPYNIISGSFRTMANIFKLPPLPYDKNALEPAISARTLSFHHGKHHKTYVETLNKLIEGTKFADMDDLETVVRESHGRDEKIFNNAAQAWNHAFYWQSLSTKGGSPSGKLKHAVEAFGGLDKLKSEFIEAAKTQFGSGWAWIVAEKGKLKVLKTANAENPLSQGGHALLAIDVWEHAYYLDYQNKRPDYVAAVVDKLLNWDFAAENFERV